MRALVGRMRMGGLLQSVAQGIEWSTKHRACVSRDARNNDQGVQWERDLSGGRDWKGEGQKPSTTLTVRYIQMLSENPKKEI